MEKKIVIQQEYTDYKVAIYYNGEVGKLSNSPNPIPNSDIKFLIQCEYIKQGNGPLVPTQYYKNKMYDERNERIEDNTFTWKGIKCKLEEMENWVIPLDEKKRNVCIVAYIWDRFNNKERKNFENYFHNGRGFKKLLEYIEYVAILSTHEGVKLVSDIKRSRDEEIQYLTKQIEKLQKKR